MPGGELGLAVGYALSVGTVANICLCHWSRAQAICNALCGVLCDAMRVAFCDAVDLLCGTPLPPAYVGACVMYI